MRLKDKIFKNYKYVTNWFLKYINLTLVLTLISLYIAYKSLVLSDLSFKQNETTSKNADSLFNIQLRNSERLNERLISEIERIQEITNQQLGITQQQLVELKKQSKPRIAINKFWFNEIYNENNESILSAKLVLSNIGGRNATNLSYKAFLVDNKKDSIIKTIKGKIISKINSGEENTFSFILMPIAQYVDHFYIIFQLSYYDDELNKSFMQDYFYKFEGSSGDDTQIYICTPIEIKNLQQIIR